MESQKQGSSDTSSEESDWNIEQVKDEKGSSTKRSYECTFCKRGFTNAQALGGHMNIHRKDRAKAKQNTANSSVSNNPNIMNEDHHQNMNPRSFVVSTEPTKYYPVLEAQKNYHMCLQPSVSSPTRPHAYNFHDSTDHFLVPRSSQSLIFNQDLLGANLSLQIGSSTHLDDNQVKRGVMEEDEVDLELRLGRHHDP